MDIEVDVLVTVRDVRAFRSLLSSLDSQTLPALAFRVVTTADGLDPAGLELLERLAAHRPNVVVGAGAAADEGVPGADRVLPVRESERLAPDALERMLACARETGAEVVIGKAVTPPADWTLLDEDRVVPVADLADVDVADLPVLMSGSSAGSQPDVAGTRRAAVGAAETVAVLASRVVLAAERPEKLVGASARRSVDVSWQAGVLELRDGVGGVARAVLRSLDSGEQWPVATADDAGTLVRIDLGSAVFGRRLPAGAWVVDLHLDPRGEQVAGATPSAPPPSALVEVVPGSPAVVALGVSGGRLLVDVGASRRLPHRIFDPGAARVAESARGTLLEWPLGMEVFAASARLDAGLRIGSFPIAAELVRGDEGATLRAWLSGLPGASRLAVRVAGSRWYDTRSELVIANAGEMSLRRAPVRAEDGSSRAAAPRRPAAAPSSPVMRLRRVVGRTPVLGDVARATARRLRAARAS